MSVPEQRTDEDGQDLPAPTETDLAGAFDNVELVGVLPGVDVEQLTAVLTAYQERSTDARLQLPDVPAYVTRQQIGDLCRLLGLNPDDVAAVHLEPSAIEVEVYARHPVTGSRFLQETETSGERLVATHQLVIPVVELPPADEPTERPRPRITNRAACRSCDRGGLVLDDLGRLLPHESRQGGLPCPGSGETPEQTGRPASP